MEPNGLMHKLKIEHLSDSPDTLCEQAAARELDYRRFLARHWPPSGTVGTEGSGEPAQAGTSAVDHRTLEQLDLSFQPTIDRKAVRELSGLAFVERAENVILLGPLRVGKTRLAIGLAANAAEAGHGVLFLTLEELMTRPKRAKVETAWNGSCSSSPTRRC